MRPARVAERSRRGSLLWRLDSHSPSTLPQTLQARANPQGSPRAPRSPTRSVGVAPAARFCAATSPPRVPLVCRPATRRSRTMATPPKTDMASRTGMPPQQVGRRCARFEENTSGCPLLAPSPVEGAVSPIRPGAVLIIAGLLSSAVWPTGSAFACYMSVTVSSGKQCAHRLRPWRRRRSADGGDTGRAAWLRPPAGVAGRSHGPPARSRRPG